jgi:hypothetical protein
MARPNIGALLPILRVNGMSYDDVDRVFATFAAAAPPFAERGRDEPPQ